MHSNKKKKSHATSNSLKTLSSVKKACNQQQASSLSNLSSSEDSWLPSIKRRRRFTAEETRVLEEEYEKDSSPNQDMIQAIANKISTPRKIVTTWFQNRRAKNKRKERRVGEKHRLSEHYQPSYSPVREANLTFAPPHQLDRGEIPLCYAPSDEIMNMHLFQNEAVNYTSHYTIDPFLISNQQLTYVANEPSQLGSTSNTTPSLQYPSTVTALPYADGYFDQSYDNITPLYGIPLQPNASILPIVPSHCNEYALLQQIHPSSGLPQHPSSFKDYNSDCTIYPKPTDTTASINHNRNHLESNAQQFHSFGPHQALSSTIASTCMATTTTTTSAVLTGVKIKNTTESPLYVSPADILCTINKEPLNEEMAEVQNVLF